MIHHHLICNGDTPDSQIGKFGLVNIRPVIQRNIHLINDFMVAGLPDGCLDNLRFTAVHIVILDHAPHFFDTGLDDLFIIDGAILAQQIFKNIGRHNRISLHE